MKAKIIIVEDHEPIRNELSILLKKYGYDIVVIENFETVVEDCLKENADLMLLDINLPLYDGYYICREIRSKSEIPIIVVTSRDSEIDELMSMNLGADDFITKPYNTQILLARIAAMLKRTQKEITENCVQYQGLKLELNNSTVIYRDQIIELSKNEMRILYTLLQSKGKIVSRDQLMETLWQSNEFIDDNTLTVNVNRVRKKLESAGLKDFVKTKRGQGYMI
jgi:DNA-binding response OmpR family regulator